jgi:hypothetical protein
MSGREESSGPQFRADRPAERPAVRTTIVGGRPPGSGQALGNIPRGVEVVLKKAAVDAEFKELLLRDRAGAAATIGLALEPAEAMMLAAAPAEQLEAIIARTTVPQQHRRVFLGQAAAAMLAALAVMTQGCYEPATKGIQPDKPKTPPANEPPPPAKPAEEPASTDAVPAPTHHIPSVGGVRPDRLPLSTDGPPPGPPVLGGSRPDRPDPLKSAE